MVCQQIEVNKIEAQCFKTPLKRVPKIVQIIGQKIVKENYQKKSSKNRPNSHPK